MEKPSINLISFLSKVQTCLLFCVTLKSCDTFELAVSSISWILFERTRFTTDDQSTVQPCRVSISFTNMDLFSFIGSGSNLSIAEQLDILKNETIRSHEETEVIKKESDQFFLIVISIIIFFMQCGFAFLEAGSVR